MFFYYVLVVFYECELRQIEFLKIKNRELFINNSRFCFKPVYFTLWLLNFVITGISRPGKTEWDS
ncbi:hypothetical protein JCM30760_19800 [Thiomicrorhabdus hydrogeniphila]